MLSIGGMLLFDVPLNDGWVNSALLIAKRGFLAKQPLAKAWMKVDFYFRGVFTGSRFSDSTFHQGLKVHLTVNVAMTTWVFFF